jgi:hypothetical protein
LAERAASGLIKSPEALAFVKSLEIKKEIPPEAVPEVKPEEAPAPAPAPVIEEAKPEDGKAIEEENRKAIAEINAKFEKEINALKEGRVLSSKNRDLIKTAVDALKALLDATDPDAEEGKSGKTLDKPGKFVIINDVKQKNDAPKPGISAEDIREAVKAINIAEIVRREIRHAKGEVE